MKRILTIICAIAFSSAALSAQNDTIKVSRDGADIELSWADKSVWGITSSHGFSFGIGLECIILRSRICRHQVFVHEDSCKPIRQPQGRSNRRYNKPWCQNICQSGSGS